MTVGGVDVGGLTAAQAKARSSARLLDPLREPIVIRRGTRSWRLGSREARIAADIDGSVDAAMHAGRDGSFLARTWRSLTGGEVEREPAAGADVRRPRRRPADRPRAPRRRQPGARRERDASPATASRRSPDHPGAASGPPRCTATSAPRSSLRPPSARSSRTPGRSSRRSRRRSSASKYPTLITVDRSGFRLTLFSNLKQVKTYPIAVGQVGLETPAGLYTIQDKQVNPSWHVPNSAWAGDLAGKVIPPGPDNPIKARWMGIFDGAGIHGTSDDRLDSAPPPRTAACACRSPTSSDLYDRVAVGTPVYIA